MSEAVASSGGESPGASVHVDWPEYHRLIERLAIIVHESGYEFDTLLCLARGGMRVGDVLSRVFEVPLAILATSSYREASGTVAGDLDIAEFITTTGGALRGRVLLVDDLVDSGTTLRRVEEHLRRRYPLIDEVRTAVLWFKDASSVAPDYYVERLHGNPWIHQPFERYDRLRPDELVERLRNEVRLPASGSVQGFRTRAAAGSLIKGGEMGLLDGILGGIVGAEVTNLVAGVIEHHGGVSGLVAQFEQQGLGGVVQSWVGNSANQPISAEQLQKVLGNDAVMNLAQKFGIDPQVLLQKVAQALPQAMDKLTPDGVVASKP